MAEQENMDAFSIPHPPASLDGRLLSVELSGSLDLEREALAKLRDLMEEPHCHWLVDYGEGEEARALFGFLGVHVPDHQIDEPSGLHYELIVQVGRTVKENRGPENWQDILERLRDEVPQHQIDTVTRFRVAGLEKFRFPLPMPLDETGLSGFSELRGARLVELDKNTEKELYSVIIDGTPREARVTVFASLDGTLHAEIFPEALKRALRIFDLVVASNRK